MYWKVPVRAMLKYDREHDFWCHTLSRAVVDMSQAFKLCPPHTQLCPPPTHTHTHTHKNDVTIIIIIMILWKLCISSMLADIQPTILDKRCWEKSDFFCTKHHNQILWSKVHQNGISDLQTKFQLILTSTFWNFH